MAEVKHSTVLNDLASFYVSKADFDFTPPTSPTKTTPPTSDSEGDPPPQAPVVDDAAAQELKNMFQNKSSTTRRSKGTARHKQSTVAAAIGGGPVGETTRKSKRTGPISSTKTSMEQNSTRSSGRGRVSGDESLGKEANVPSAFQRLKERSLSKSNRNDGGGGDSALEILKARSISRSRSKVVTSSQLHERASRRRDHQGDTTAETQDHHEISSSISSPKSQRSRKLPGRSKSSDLELLVSTQNERRLVSRVAEQEVPLKGDDGDDSTKKKTRSLSRERRRGIGRSKSDDLTQLSAHGRSQSQTRGHSRDGGRRRRRSADADDGKMIEAAMQMVDPSLLDPDVDAEVTRIISGRKAVEEASPTNGDMDVSHRSSRASLRGQRTASSGSIGSAEKPSSASKRSSRMRALKSTSVNEMQVKSQEAPSSKSLSESSRSQGSSGERLSSKTKSIRRHISRRPTHGTTQSLSSTDKGASVTSKNDTDREKKPHRHRSKRYERHHKPASDETKVEDQHTRPGATESRSRHMSSRPSKGRATVVQGHPKPYVGNQESNSIEHYENSEERDGTGSNPSMDVGQNPTSTIISLQESDISQTKELPDKVGRETPLDTSPVATKMIKPASSMFKGLLGKKKSMHGDCVEKKDDTPTKTAEKATQGDNTQHPTRKPPEKSRSQNGMSVLKNLLRKGSVVGEGDQNGEKKGQRWNGLKGGVDFTNRLKKAAGIERKASRPSKSEVRLDGDGVEQSIKAPTDDPKENVVSMEKQEEVNGLDHGYGMMMSLASFAPEDVEGLEEFHASLVGHEDGNCDQDELSSSKSATETATSELRAPDLFCIMEKGIPKDPSAGNIDCDVPPATDRRKVFSTLTAPSMRLVSDKSTETITDKAPPPVVLEECEEEDEDEVDEGKDSTGIAESVVPGFGIQSECAHNDCPVLESDTETETKLDAQFGIAHDQGLDVIETEKDESEATQMDEETAEPEPLLSPLKFMQLTFKPNLSPAGELPIAIHTIDDNGPASEADGDLHVMEKVDGEEAVDVKNESLLSPQTGAQTDHDYKDKTEVSKHFETAVAPLDTFAPSATEIEYDELRRQLAASAARRKQSREAVRKLQEEILRHQEIYENACKERDAAMKALQEKRIKISL